MARPPRVGGSAGNQGIIVPSVVGEEIIGEIPANPQELGAQQPSEAVIVDTAGELGKILAILTAVNDIRAQIIRLGLNPALRFAIETEVAPVINILLSLATAADFFSVSAFNMSNINLAKNHEIKKTLDLIYNITDLSEDVLEVVIKLVLATLPKTPY